MPPPKKSVKTKVRRLTVDIRPQRMQQVVLSSVADIIIAGGAAGSGKTYSVLLEPLRHVKDVPSFGAVIFRRTYPEITNEGGMWDDSHQVYQQFGATSRETDLEWTFPSGATVRFSHMEHEKDRLKWKGSQIALICFDQLEDFTERQFWYMLSRNRSTCGVPPYIMGTCNPVTEDDPTGGWLHKLIQWWIDPDTGYPILERSGVVRWFVRRGDSLEWGDSRRELVTRYPKSLPKSLTFIPGKLEDNPALTSADPAYRANLEALPMVERERLLHGNWNVRPTAGKVFNRAWFDVVGSAPDKARRVRSWDKASTAGGGDWSAGVKVSRSEDGVYFIEHVVRGQWSSLNRNKTIKQTAQVDGRAVHIVLEQEPGSGGKESAEISVRDLEGYRVTIDRVTGDKVTRAGPLSAQAEAGNVKVVRGPWAQAFIDELHAFDGADGGQDDQVDAASGGFNYLATHSGGFHPDTWSHSKSTDRRVGEVLHDPRYGDPVVAPKGYSERGDMPRGTPSSTAVTHDMLAESHRVECRACRRAFLDRE